MVQWCRNLFDQHVNSRSCSTSLHHPDEVLSKKDILDHVWDFDFDGDPNIVEVYVRRLRTKLPRPE